MHPTSPSAAEQLVAALAALQAEDPRALDPGSALERARLMAAAAGQMQCAWLDSLADVEDRELFADDGAGSARGWLRQQPCGDGGQLSLARRLQLRIGVHDALAAGTIGVGAAGSVCQALVAVDDLEAAAFGEAVPLPEAQVIGVLTGAVPQALSVWAGWAPSAVGAMRDLNDTAQDDTAQDELPDGPLDGLLDVRQVVPPVVQVPGLAEDVRNALTGRRELLAQVLLTAASATHLATSARLEPVLVLLARALSPHALTNALSAILDALAPERLEEPAPEPYLDLAVRSDGMWDVRGLLEAEDGEVFTQELLRRMRLLRGRPDPDDLTSENVPTEDVTHEDVTTDDLLTDDLLTDDLTTDDLTTEDVVHLEEAAHADDGNLERDSAGPVGGTGNGNPDATPGEHPPPLPTLFGEDDPLWGLVGPGLPLLPPSGEPDRPVEGAAAPGLSHSTRYAAFQSLLHDALTCNLGSGSPPPAKVTIIATAEFASGVPGAHPAQLKVGSQLRHLSATALRRTSCDGLLAAVILDATGTPIGASGTHRHATDRERRALQARWGLACAVNGCCNTQTIPHHVQMFSRTGTTRLADLIPVCLHHHKAIHDGQRTLRLRDGRYLDETGWLTTGLRAA